jgi:hypothetical protein
MKQVAIVIPVYKADPSPSEVKSLEQAIRVFGGRDFIMVTHRNLDIRIYLELFAKENVTCAIQNFDSKWFQNVKSYSRMLMSTFFYQAFRDYKFIQIYQLDAWVFKDELDLWCNKSYSYIGAPFADRPPFCVGNGGFSLRKIADLQNILDLGKELNRMVPYMNPRLHDPWGSLNLKGKFMAIARYMGFFRSYRFFLEHSTLAEDAFWGTMASDLNPGFHVPDVNEASLYAWDANPSFFYERSNGVLPMGCHGMEKWDSQLWEKVCINSN